MGNKNRNSQQSLISHPKTREEFRTLHESLTANRYVAISQLKPGLTRTLTLGDKDPSINKASDLASCIGKGAWSTGPLASVAWSFDEKDENAVTPVPGQDGKPLGLGYVKWGPGNCTPSTIPVLALASPYTGAPLRYIADLTAGLGPRLMYRFPDGTLCEFRDAGELLKQKIRELEKKNPEDVIVDEVNGVVAVATGGEKKPNESQELKDARQALVNWERTWYGYDETDKEGNEISDPGAKRFLEENNLDLHLSQCEQDDVMLDIYFPTVGLQRGRRGRWIKPKVVQVSVLQSHSTRLEKCNEYRHINHVYFSDQWRTLGAGKTTTVGADNNNIVMYPAAMPQHLLSDMRYIVESNQRTRIKDRPTWIVCPTFYPSGNKIYYPQPAWWSVFSSKAYDFSSTILYDKAKQRENRTSWGRILYISLDYLETVFGTLGLQGDQEAQDKFVEDLEQQMEDFLQHRENTGKMMRQWMWTDQKGDEHYNVKIVDVADAVKDVIKAGKEELELSTSPIFLALQVDPRLVGVPMVAASNGGTALREMHLLKQQQLSVKQRLYLEWLNKAVCRFNEWDEHAEFHIVQQTLTTLDNSKTGTVETIASKGA